MHIVYVTAEYINPHNLVVIDGGLANYLHKVTTTLSKIGHNVTVIVVRSDEDKTILYKGIKVVFINTTYKKSLLKRLIYMLTFKNYKEYKKNYFWHKISETIRKLNKEKKIDIIQYASWQALGCHPEKNIPSCVRISSYAKLMHKYYKTCNPTEIDLETKQFKNTQFLFGPSKHIADYIKQDLNLNKEIKIIESPYSEEVYEEDTSALDELKNKIQNKPYLLFFGTIGELKGCGVIADCIYDILKAFPDLNLVLVGKNVSINNIDYLQIIKEKAKEFSNRVIRFESLPHKQLYPIIKGAYGVLMPSLTENFSNACVEAMRLKKIVIGTEENFSQLITDNKSGFLSKVGDSESLKEKIIELLNLPQDKKLKMEEKAFLRTECLSPTEICNQLINYYKYVIKHWEVK